MKFKFIFFFLTPLKIDKLQARLKSNKRITDEYEEEISQLKAKIRKLQRDAEEATEQADKLNHEVQLLRNKQR